MSGIGEYSAILILGEIGDIKRLKTPKALVSYAGLCPGSYQSGNTEKTERNQANSEQFPKRREKYISDKNVNNV